MNYFFGKLASPFRNKILPGSSPNLSVAVKANIITVLNLLSFKMSF
jgi:hypothetical protein